MDTKIEAVMRTGIVTADATRARLYTFDELAAPVDVPTHELRERVTLVDPARRRRASELFSDTRPGLDRAPNGRGFAHDDRRDAARRRMDSDFARDIAQACGELVRSHGVSRLVVAASPRMLGFLRELGPLAAADVELCEIDRDLVHLSNAQLHDYLADRGLLPTRERIGLAGTALNHCGALKPARPMQRYRAWPASSSSSPALMVTRATSPGRSSVSSVVAATWSIWRTRAGRTRIRPNTISR